MIFLEHTTISDQWRTVPRKHMVSSGDVNCASLVGSQCSIFGDKKAALHDFEGRDRHNAVSAPIFLNSSQRLRRSRHRHRLNPGTNAAYGRHRPTPLNRGWSGRAFRLSWPALPLGRHSSVPGRSSEGIIPEVGRGDPLPEHERRIHQGKRLLDVIQRLALRQQIDQEGPDPSPGRQPTAVRVPGDGAINGFHQANVGAMARITGLAPTTAPARGCPMPGGVAVGLAAPFAHQFPT